MKLAREMIPGTLLRRYKRFLADVELPDGTVITAHTPNSGSMMGCAIPGSPVLLSRSGTPGRKYPLTWELVQVNGFWIGINTAYPPKLVREGVENGTVRELQGYQTIKPEVVWGESRIDLFLDGGPSPCWVEVKNVTLVEGGTALFPDAVTTRGQKHLRELQRLVLLGQRGVIFYVVQREDAQAVAPANRIDPEYGRLLREVVAQGVEALAYRAQVTPAEIILEQRLPVLL
jgi:sugar fermentation stimulation protein A